MPPAGAHRQRDPGWAAAPCRLDTRISGPCPTHCARALPLQWPLILFVHHRRYDMGLFSFIKEAGEKLFGGKEAQAATPAGPTQDELNTKAAQAIETYIASQNLGASNVQVAFDGTQGKVTVKGTAPTQAAKEKVTLCCG